MDQLRFTAVHEDGQHLVLSSSDGTEVLLPIDERLRAALRPRGPAADAPATALRPRDVQAMIRAGQSPAEVAEITGWPADRVARFEAPILAEREHVAGMARAAHVRGRAPEGGIPTLESRVRERLSARGVDADNIGWDATRPEGGRWTVIVSFVAGQRQRSAGWTFDPADRTVDALDDEARWLSEDEQSLPGSAAGRELLGGAGASEEVDLMTSMRERSRSRGRRKKPSVSRTDPAGLPDLANAPEGVLPLEDLSYDPETMGLPPAAHGESEAPDAGNAAKQAAGKAAGSTARGGSASPAAAGATAKSGQSGPPSAPEATGEVETPAESGAPAGDDVDPADGTTSYDVELDFDENDFEVDPRPQAATLADLFGPGDDEGAAPEDEFEDEDESEDIEGDLEEEDLDDQDLGDDELADGELLDVHSPQHEPEQSPVIDPSAQGATEGETPEDDEVTAEEPAAAADTTSVASPDSSEGTPAPPSEPESAAAPAPEQPKRRKDGRPGVPSWDDIMFGAKDRGH